MISWISAAKKARRGRRTEAMVFGSAWWLDGTFQELPSRIHPVVWIGHVTRLATRRLRGRRGWDAKLWGGVASLSIISGTALTAHLLDLCLTRLPPAFEVPSRALLLTPSFAARSLIEAADRVADPLAKNDLDAARQGLSWLCSRDPEHLTEEELANATIASLAENTCDSVVAPLMAWCIAGAAGAWLVRAANTLDAMIGYENADWKDAGYFAAKFDDVINYVPARCTGFLVVAAAAYHGYDGKTAWKIMLRDHTHTPSPNGGWPMAAMAGALGICIRKPGVYALMDEGRTATVDDIRAAQRIARTAMQWSASGALAFALVTAHRAHPRKKNR